MRETRKKKFIIPLTLLLSVLGLAVVYAAVTGVLNFRGTAVVNPNAHVIIQDAHVEKGKPTDLINISSDKQSLDFTVHLDNPGDDALVGIRLLNDGNVPVTLGSLIETTKAPAGVTVTWPKEFDGLRLEPGIYTEYFNVHVEWTGTGDLTADNFTFSATLNYTQAP